MKTALGFSCNNNTEAEITRSLDPWVDHVDLIIAIEGRYRIPYSPAMMKGPIPAKFGTDTEDILRKHYGDKILYHEYYGEQKNKRQKYLDMATGVLCDVVIVWDTDDIIIDRVQDAYNPNWDRFYKLIGLAHEFAEGQAGLLDMWAWIPNEELWPRQFNKIKANTWHRYHRIHLNPGKQKYILNHYTMAANQDVTEEQVLEFSTKDENKTERNPYLLYPQGVAEGIRFTTDRKLRTEQANTSGDSWAWQLMQEETYRAYLVEIKIRGEAGEKTYKEQYREPFTYWFDHNGRPVMYTKEELELFNQLEL